ncbi:hypothetical protein BU16DRAFT_566435 [Lophium mytilinum]|uniref:CBM-cenC domain-containing protein n=1 Tax=Lophium mytilinum TaxID=390894 RepID=A0A6A6QFL8_9PEZI|nr:hypothetical protein BU16DRAFT_566435 [Lophium mytilinum]
MLILLSLAIAQLLAPITALSVAKRATNCAGIDSGSTYTAGGKLFAVEADALRSNNNLGDPLFGGSFIDCMTSCATTTGCTDVSYTSGGTCYLKQGTVGGITGIETGTCDGKIVQPSSTCNHTANAVVNGDFENQCCGYLAPWIVVPGRSSDNTVLKGPGAGGGTVAPGPADGNYVISVQQTDANAISYITQGISVCPGTTYRLSLAARRNSAASTALAFYVSATVDIGTKGYNVIMYSKNVASSDWTTFTADQNIVIPATELTSTYGVLQIQFSNVAQANTGTKEIWVDSIKLMPVS